MESETKKDTKGRKKRRKRKSKEDDYEFYLVAIEDWEWGFSFGINETRFDDGAYSDYRHLHLTGKLISPPRIKAGTARLILMPEPDLRGRRYEREPQSIGSVRAFRGAFSGLLTMPSDALAPVLQMLIAGKFRFADLYGSRMRYGSAAIKRFSLEMNIEEEDFLATETVAA